MKTSPGGGLAVREQMSEGRHEKEGEARRPGRTWANAVAVHCRAPIRQPLRVADVHRLRTVESVAEAGVEGGWEGDNELARVLHRVKQLNPW